MKITSDSRTIPFLKATAEALIDQINNTRRPVIITQNGEPKVELQYLKNYEDMRNVLGLLKVIAQGEEDVRQGKVREQNEVFDDLEKR
jgi:prevent-host-death family protein